MEHLRTGPLPLNVYRSACSVLGGLVPKSRIGYPGNPIRELRLVKQQL